MPEKRKLSRSKLFVKKFGGTSVGSIERIEVVAEQIAKSARSGEQQVLVLSAMAGRQIDFSHLPRKLTPVPRRGNSICLSQQANK